MKPICIVLAAVLLLAGPGRAGAAEEPLFEAAIDQTPLDGVPENINIWGAWGDLTDYPIMDAFGVFHFERNLRFLHDLRDHIKANDPSMTLAGNLHGITDHPRWLEMARAFDYINMEWTFDKDPDRLDFWTLLALGQAAERQFYLMGGGDVNLRFKRNHDPVLYHAIAARAYAAGHILHVPHALWDGSYRDRWWARYEDHEHIFRFVADHPELFDGYEQLALTALLLPYPERTSIEDPLIEGWVNGHMRASQSPVILYSGEPFAPYDAAALGQLDAVERLGDLEHFLPRDRDFAKSVSNADASNSVPGRFQASVPLTVLPRIHRERADAPVILHVLETEMPVEDNKTRSNRHQQVELTIDLAVLGGQSPRSIRYHRPGLATEVLAFDADDASVSVTLPGLEVWGVLEIDARDQSANPYRAASISRPPALTPSSTVALMRTNQTYPNAPEWIADEAKRGRDPYTVYGVDFISWEYSKHRPMLDEMKARGIAIIGTINVGSGGLNEDRPPGWLGWARDFTGDDMVRRADWQHYVACASSPQWMAEMKETLQLWYDLGVDGIQFDDIGFAVHISWNRGGDYNPYFVGEFKQRLAGLFSKAELAEMGIDDLERFDLAEHSRVVRRKQLGFGVNESDGARFFEMRRIENLQTDDPIWLSSPAIHPGQKWVNMNLKFRFPEKTDGFLGLYLMDAQVADFAGTLLFEPGSFISYYDGIYHNLGSPEGGAWHELAVSLDTESKLMNVALNGEVVAREMPMRNPGSFDRDKGFTFVLMKRPSNGQADIAHFEATESAEPVIH